MEAERRYSGKRQRFERRAQEIPQWLLGARVGTCQSEISNIERGKRVPLPHVQRRIAAVLGVELSDLMEPVGVERDSGAA